MARHTGRCRLGAAVAAYWIGLLAFAPAPAAAFAGGAAPAAETVEQLGAEEEQPARGEVAAGSAAPAAGAGSAGRSEREPGRRTTRRDLFRLGGSVTVDGGERLRGDATVVLGSLTVDGEVTGDVVVIAGPARFGPQAEVRGDVTVVGGSLQQAPSAAFRGSVTHVGLGGVGSFAGFGGWRDAWTFGWHGRDRLGGGGLLGTAMRLVFLALLASGIVLVARGPVERVARRVSAEPLKAGVAGVAAQILVVPLLVSGILVLVISIVGIPLLLLLPFVVMAVVLFMLVGFSGAVLGAGELLRGRMGVSSAAACASVWAGVALILLPTLAGEAVGMAGGFFRGLGVLLALAGFCLEYAAWTAGLGALILNRFAPPPPAPGSAPYAGLPAPPPTAAPPVPPPTAAPQ